MRWFEDCRRVVEGFAKFVTATRLVEDIRPEDFLEFRKKILRHGFTDNKKGLGVHAMIRVITVIKGMFKYAYDMGILDSPVRYGRAFDKPSETLKRKRRHAKEQLNGKRLFEPSEILSLLEIAGTQLRAMIFLGINGGFGNKDCACLPINAIDFKKNVINFDRPKTGIERSVPLWLETKKALREVLADRPKPSREAENLLFITNRGKAWVRERVHRINGETISKVVPINSVALEFGKLLKKLGINRKGIGFYALRHTFRTWADEAHDQHAIHRIMGHAIPGMSGVYVEIISLGRLRAVADHVRDKLFGSEKTTDM